MTAPDPNPIQVAVVGAGAITQAVHLPAIDLLRDRFQLRAVCDLSMARADALAARWGDGTRATARYDDILAADDVEAVLLATPGTQAELTSAALSAGKHVLAEKPLCLTRQEADDLGHTADDGGLILQVGYMKMYDPLIEVARRELARLEPPTLIRITVLHPAQAPQIAHVELVPAGGVDPAAIDAAVAYERDRTREAIGDVGADLAACYRDVLQASVIHELSVLRALGVPLPMTFDRADVWPWPARPGPPSLLASARLDGGSRLSLSWNWLPEYPRYREEIAVFARHGHVVLDVAVPYRLDARSTLRVERAGQPAFVIDGAEGHGRTGHVAQLEAFASSVRDGAPVLADAAGAAADTRCLQSLLVAVADAVGVTVGGEAAAATDRRVRRARRQRPRR